MTLPPPDAARAAAFALFSRLLGSPYASGPAGMVGMVPADVTDALAVIEGALPYVMRLDDLSLEALRLRDDPARDGETVREYGAIFEVGRNGPPLPIRQELLYDETKSTQKKEELVRFYDFFEYTLEPSAQWAPDHLAVAFEFQHYLAYRATSAPNDPGGNARERADPFRRAGRDFSARHLVEWTATLAEAVPGKTDNPYLRALTAAARSVVSADLAYLNSVLSPEPVPSLPRPLEPLPLEERPLV